MKTLQILIIAILFSVSITLSQSASAQTAHEILQERDNTPATQLSYDGSVLIINQTIDKLEYKMGENITIHPEMINIGTTPVTVANGTPLFDIQVMYQNGTKVFDSGYSGMLIVGWGFTLNPGMTMHDNRTWGWNPHATTPVIKLDTPGKYTVLTESNISLYDTAEQSSHAIPPHPEKSLWSKPLQITVLPEKYVQNETSPVIISQVELDSPFLLMPDNQTCTLPAKPGFINNCLTDLISGKKVQCSYFIGSSTCEPLHQYTSGTNQSCFGPDGSPNAPQWFDLYNTQNKTLQIQLFQLIILQGEKPWGNEGLFPTTINLGPHEKCTIGLGPSDEPLSLDQTNMGFAASYTFEGKNYTASTPPMTDLYNDTRTWQYDGNKWTFAEQNTVTIPEFPFTIPIFLVSIASLIIFYRVRFRK
jgi:hypothetical protein